jgi:hypothetical protein
MITFIIAACVSADDPAGAEVRKVLTAREDALKGATWRFQAKGSALPSGRVPQGTVQLSGGAIVVSTAEPQGVTKRVQSPSDEWMEVKSTAGKKTDVTKAKAQAVREDRAFKSAEMQGLAVEGRYGPLSKFLEKAKVEKKLDGAVQFTVSEKQRLEFDFEGKAPFRLKEVRHFADGGRGHEFARNVEYGEASGQWFSKKFALGKSDAAGKAGEPTVTVEIADFQTTSAPIDLARMESGLKGAAGKGGPPKGGGKKGDVAQKGGGQKKAAGPSGPSGGRSMPPPSDNDGDSGLGKGRFDASRFAWAPVGQLPPMVQWILPATCAGAILMIVLLLRRRTA